MTTLWTGLTHLHGMIGGLCLAGLFAAYLTWTGRTRWLKALLLVLPSGMLVNVVIKQLMHRPRPLLGGALVSTRRRSVSRAATPRARPCSTEFSPPTFCAGPRAG